MNGRRAYESELLKQTEPYQYFLQNKNIKSEERGKSMKIDGPLPCVINISGIGAHAYEINVYGENITYVILKNSYILPKEEDESLFGEEIFKDIDEKLIPDLIYSDHDYITSQNIRHTPYFKPDYSPHTLLGSNYIGEVFAVRKDILLDVLSDDKDSLWSAALNDCLGKSYDEKTATSLVLWALLLDICSKCNLITHVSDALYSCSSDDISEGIYLKYEELYSTEAAKHIREKAESRMGITEGNNCPVSIIIPSKDNSDLLTGCIENIKIKTRFNENPANELIVIDNGSSSSEREKIEGYFSDNSDLNIKYIYDPSDFNYAAMCNKAAEASKGELLLFMNDDVEPLSCDFIDMMSKYALASNVGAVGCKLLYPKDNLIQHVGITSLNCGPTHKLATYSDGNCYYFGANRFIRNCLAVTGACMMITREKYFQVGGFHDKMKVSYNDVDLCVNLYEKGLFNVVLNDVVLIHHESLTRGSDLESADKYLRLKSERDLFCDRHRKIIENGDPFYNNNLIQDSLDYRPNVIPDYEIRDRLSHVEVFSCKRFRKAFRDRLKITVEDCSTAFSFDDANIRLVTFSGWSLLLKKDERMYDRFILFVGDDGSSLKVEMMPKYRTDVGEVFTDKKYIKLAGFVARIPENTFKEGIRYRVGVMYVHRILRIGLTAFADYYEPGKGYGE